MLGKRSLDLDNLAFTPFSYTHQYTLVWLPISIFNLLVQVSKSQLIWKYLPWIESFFQETTSINKFYFLSQSYFVFSSIWIPTSKLVFSFLNIAHPTTLKIPEVSTKIDLSCGLDNTNRTQNTKHTHS